MTIKTNLSASPIILDNVLKYEAPPGWEALVLNMIVACKLHCSNRNQLLILNQDEKQQGADN